MDQTTQPNKTSFVLQLWPSFESIVQGSSSPEKQPYTTFTISNLDPTLTEISIASGAAHFLILIHNNVSTDEHSYKSLVYGFGDNRFGQLGLGTYSTRVDSPELIQGLEGVKSIDCGSFHSLALGADGTLYAFGHNRHGQCGVGETARNLSSPTLVDIGGAGETGDIIDVLQARCGSEHTVALTSEGVWVVGSSDLGQLGTPGVKSEKEFKLNKMIGQLMGVNTKQQEWTIVCGRWNTFVYD
ncbi:hypothetical protein CROQUDRAFT_40162 [Cronartium quercuum f. sp. fusiforme G11]|uniref:Regulator of chromosome condensation 1/beta-lactamase-inhibitor protein II n=1 Tax=Cronartium quercuum f. sp. fusiforme G11 TaxID=708437 RepID=A0A9P6TG23_9BASI|nr:hypothetical protein CROQUDRAFT_40162 [Cronartium quercuum f. sp. fusiforme G11]